MQLWTRRAALSLGVFLLAGCVTNSSIHDGAEVEAGSGLLAMQVTANQNSVLNYVDYSPVSNYGTRLHENMLGPKGALHFTPGNHYWLISVPEGEYMWSKFTYGNFFSNIQSSNHFWVKSDSTTYIGHLYITVDFKTRRFEIRVVDDSADMKQYLADSYPNYSATLPFQVDVTEILPLRCGRSPFGSCSNPEAPPR